MFDESLLTPVESGFDESLLEPVDERAQRDVALRAEKDKAARESDIASKAASFLGGQEEFLRHPITGLMNVPRNLGAAVGVPESFLPPEVTPAPMVSAENIIAARDAVNRLRDQAGLNMVPDMETSPAAQRAEQRGEGVFRAGANLASGMTTPEMAPFALLPYAGPLVRTLAGAAFGGQMASQVPESARRLGQASVTGTPLEQGEAGGELAANLLLPAAIGVAPEVAARREGLPFERVGTETPQPTPEVSNARSQQKSAEIHGDVRTQPVEGAGEVPVEEGGAGVRPDIAKEPTPAQVQQEARGEDVLPPLSSEQLSGLKAEGDVPEGFGVKTFALAGESPASVEARASLYRTPAPFGIDLVKQGGFELRDRAPELAGVEQLNPTSAAQWAALNDARKGGPGAMREWVDEAFKTRVEQRKAMADYESSTTDAAKEDAIQRAQVSSNQFINEGLQAVGNWGKEFGVDAKTVSEARRLSAEFSKGAEVPSEPAPVEPNAGASEPVVTGAKSSVDYTDWNSKQRVNGVWGGSHRLIKRQQDAFDAAGIPWSNRGSHTLGSKRQTVLVPNTPEAIALLKKVGGSVTKAQWDFLTRDTPGYEASKTTAPKEPGQPWETVAANEGPTAGRIVKALNDIGISTIDTHGAEGSTVRVRIENPWETIPIETQRELMRLGKVMSRPQDVVENGVGEMAITFDKDVSANISKLKPVIAGPGEMAKAGGDVPIQDRISDAESRLLRLGKLRAGAYNLLVDIQSEASRREMSDTDYLAALQRGIAVAERQVNPPGSIGPGAQTRGEPKYQAIQQLTDQLNAAPPVGSRESKTAREAITERWAEGKSAVDRSVGRMRNISQTIKDIARGVRKPTDIDRTVAALDADLQQSVGESMNAGKALERQMPNSIDRNAAALLIEPGMTPEVLKDALGKLPKGTPLEIRKTLERAANATPEMKQYGESLKQYFGIREQDAVNSDLFDQGLRDYYTHIWKKEENMPDSLRGAFNSGKVSTYFQFGKQRTIPTLLEGILQGKKPVLDPAKVVPFYNHAMDKAIASREFVRSLTDLKASDGRPMAEPSGVGQTLDRGEKGDPKVLVNPKAKPEEIADYRQIDHPAMRKWKWVTKTPEGASVIVKGDLLVHPEVYERLARIMDKSRLSSGPLMRAALAAGAEVKGLKLGGIPSPFHQMHVGSHALFHWTNPFNAKAIDWSAPETRFALEQGHLKLAPDSGEVNAVAEGIGSSKLAQKIPIIGTWGKTYTHYLFADLIPRLKLKTFENAYARAQWMKNNLGAFKGLTDEEIAARTGDSVNNAYGELNHLFLGKLGRNPTVQRGLRLAFLAPDFGEARLRFVEKAATRFGHEERIAMATMFTTLYVGARIANYLSHGNAEMDPERAFQVKAGKHWWTMRSVLGDLVHAIEKPGQFTYVRLSPLYSRTASDFLIGRDPKSGRKLTGTEKIERIAQQALPIPLGGLTREDQKLWESFVQSMGVSAIRDTPVMDVQRMASKWKQSKGMDPGPEFIPTDEPSYYKLRMALNLGNKDHAATVLEGLRKTKSDRQIAQSMDSYVHHPFTGSNQNEYEFLKSLKPDERTLYQRARQEQTATLHDFYDLLARHPRRGETGTRRSTDLERLRAMTP